MKKETQIQKEGNRFKKMLGHIATKKYGFFDWQFADYGHNKIVFEYYFDKIASEALPTIEAFMTNNYQFQPELKGGSHDRTDRFQIVLKITVPTDSF